jgi:radical SAM superfamily enzyme YgiQ (UPF0313 family)
LKVLLINPPTPAGDVWVREGRCQQFDIWGAPFPPISLAFVKTKIRDVAKTLLLDPAPAKMTLDEVMARIRNFAPEVMIMATTTPTFNSDTGWFAAQVKALLPEIKIGAFGVHVSRLPVESLEAAPDVDFVLKGEPEAVVLPLVEALAAGADLAEVPGVAFRNGAGIKDNMGISAPSDVDSYGFPDWSDIEFSNYPLPVKNRPFSLISFSRGCPHACTYCAASAYYGKKLRERSVEKLIEEIHYNLDLGVRDFLFWTELLSADLKFLNRFLDALFAEGLDKKIRWVSNSRVDGLDKETVEKMKRAGCWQIAFGLEFGTDKALKLVKKGGRATVALGRKTVEMVNRAGIAVDGHFILGYPGENEEDMQATVDYAASLPLTFANFYMATPFPGSPLYESYIKQANGGQASWDHISQDQYVFTENGLTQELVQRYITKAYRKFYLSPARIMKIRTIAEGLGENINLIKLGTNFAADVIRG